MTRYYSIMRPVGPGTFPKDGVVMIQNYDSRQYVEEIGREAWGCIDYTRELDKKEAESYELVKAKTAQEKLNDLFEELVPASGAAESVAGEIVRAICRIGYRNFNDGDHLGIDYGRETCNPAGRYLAAKCSPEVARLVQDAWEIYDDRTYDKALERLEEGVLKYIEEHPELKEEPNKEDMWDYRDEQEDVDTYDDEDEDDYYEEDEEDEDYE
ncbi:hypothetical protein EI53_01228 [Fusobacterium naviforme]|nr:hypothetical protein EI53_01228 [Fusobacterium naviforme]STO27576.1 Uncharacterised protein [Fusobacterium naviforme]